MKKLLILLLFAVGCVATEDIDEGTPIVDNVVKIEVLSSERQNDELIISYYEYETDTHNYQPYPVPYDAAGNPEPIVIIFDDYDFRYINGEVYRNNALPSDINLKIYLNDEVIIDETVTGNGVDYPIIRFNYDIKTMSNI